MKYNVQAPTDVAETVFPAWQAADLALQLAQDLSSPMSTKLTTGLTAVDKVLNPMLRDRLITVLGRPANAKSFFADYLLASTIDKIMKTGKQNEQVVILISAEVSVEVTALKWMVRYSKNVSLEKVLRGECSKNDLEEVETASYRVLGLPLIIIGHSSERSKENKRVRPMLSPDVIDKALEYIFNEYKNPITGGVIEPQLIVTDYLQLLHKPPNFNGPERVFFSDCMRWAKDVALWGGCPHVINVQAKREVDDREIKIPQLSDGMETAAIEQFSDIVFSVHMPKTYNIQLMRAFSSWNLPETVVTDDMIYLALLKQKDGRANRCWIYHADFDTLGLIEH